MYADSSETGEGEWIGHPVVALLVGPQVLAWALHVVGARAGQKQMIPAAALWDSPPNWSCLVGSMFCILTPFLHGESAAVA